MSDVPPAPSTPVERDATHVPLGVVGALAVVVFLAVVVGDLRRSPGLGGLAHGVLFGGVAAVGFSFAIRWLLKTVLMKSPGVVTLAGPGDALPEGVAETLRELETARVDYARRINARMATRLPLGLGAGVLFWAFLQFQRDPAGVVPLVTLSGFGAATGWAWAAGRLSNEYKSLYKTRVLPKLLAPFGRLDWRAAETPDLTGLGREGVVGNFDAIHGDDELFGDYRGLKLSIVELSLTLGSGKEQTTPFDGLILRLDLPRRLAGTTAVVTDAGFIGRLGHHGRERVELEDVAFEKLYDVWGSDQIAARALLTPAFMTRFLALGDRPGFKRPTALAEDARLCIAWAKDGSRDLLEPPSYSEPAASRDALTRLQGDVRALLDAADAVIDLDYASRAVAADAAA